MNDSCILPFCSVPYQRILFLAEAPSTVTRNEIYNMISKYCLCIVAYELELRKVENQDE
jgi:hypothetical protein